MKKFILVLLTSLWALSLVGCTKAKAAAHDAATPGPTGSGEPAGPLAWEELQVEDHSFNVAFPGKPIVQFRQSDEGKQILCGLDLPGDVRYSVIMNQINVKEPGPPPKARLKALLSRAALYYGASAKLESSKENLKVDGNEAVEYNLSFVHEGKKLKLRCRAFFAHDCHQMYQLLAAGPDGAPETQHFLDSFKLGKYTPGHPELRPTPTASAEASAHE